MSSTLVLILTTVLELFSEDTIPISEELAREQFLFLAPDTDMNISVFLSCAVCIFLSFMFLWKLSKSKDGAAAG